MKLLASLAAVAALAGAPLQAQERPGARSVWASVSVSLTWTLPRATKVCP